MNELLTRLKADTPKFFKRLQVFGASIVTMGTALLAIPKAPAGIQHLAENIIVAGLVIVAVAQMAVKNIADVEKTTNNNAS